jgi:hypothetical protein
VDPSTKTKFKILYIKVKGAARLNYQNLAAEEAQTTKLYQYNK